MPALTTCSSSSGTGGFSLAPVTRPPESTSSTPKRLARFTRRVANVISAPVARCAIHQAAKIVVEQQVTGDDQQRLQVRVGAIRPHRAGGPRQPLLDLAPTPGSGPDLRWSATTSGRWCRATTMRCGPVAATLSSARSSRVWPRTGSIGLGTSAVSGRSRRPSPLASTMAPRPSVMARPTAREGGRIRCVSLSASWHAFITTVKKRAIYPRHGYLTLSRRRDIPPPVAAVTGGSLYWVERAQ